MPEHGLFSAGIKDQRILFVAFRRTDWALRRFDMAWQRVVAPLFHHGRVYFKLSGWCTEALRLVFLILNGNFNAMVFYL